MKKSRISLLLVFTLCVTLLSGCGEKKNAMADKPVKDLFTASVEKIKDLESSHGKMDLQLNVELPESMQANPQFMFVAPLLKDAKLTMDQNYMYKDHLGFSKITAEAGSQKFDADFYMQSATKFAVKSETLKALLGQDKAIVLDMEKIQELAKNGNANIKMMDPNFIYSEEFKKVFDAYMNILELACKDLKPTRADEEVEFADGKASIHTITVSFKNNEELLAAYKTMIKNVLEAENLYELITNEDIINFIENPAYGILAEGQSFKDQIPSKEEFDKARKEGIEKFDTAWSVIEAQFNQFVTINDFTMKIGFDKDAIARTSSFNLDIVVKSPMGEVPVKLNLNSVCDKINAVKKEDIKTIELTDENSITLEKLMEDSFGAPMMDDMETESMDMNEIDMEDMDAEQDTDADNTNSEDTTTDEN